MAGADWANLEPERRYARLFAAHHDVVPPIPISDLLRVVADVEVDVLPGEADAIVLRKPEQRPRVIISWGLTDNRRRFTLAHELGHIVLPWQDGTAFCHPRATYAAGGDYHVGLEAQANRFAGELLVPRPWLAERISVDSTDLADQIVGISKLAEVSPITASIALGPVYPFPAATRITTAGRAPYLSFSETWRLRREFDWWESRDELLRIGGHISQASFGPYTLQAMVFANAPTTTAVPSEKDSRTLLAEILGHLSPAARLRLTRVVSGVIGSANNYPEAQVSEAALLRVLHQRFLGRDDIAVVTAHPLFQEFVGMKARELHARKAKRHR